jgi:hypothetical protein
MECGDIAPLFLTSEEKIKDGSSFTRPMSSKLIIVHLHYIISNYIQLKLVDLFKSDFIRVINERLHIYIY